MRILSVTILGMALSLGACQQRQSVEPEPEPAPSQAIAAEFQAVADALLNSDNPYLGRQQLEAHRTSLEQERSPSPLRVNLGLQLCWTQLRLGDIDAAAQTIEGAFADVAAIGGLPSGSMLKLRGLVYLREAEYRNCVERHTAQCCLFPLSGGGVHALKQPAALARDSFLEMLKLQPNDIEARWLLNITGMAIGGYPENTPVGLPHQGTPPSLYRNRGDGTFEDVAGTVGLAGAWMPMGANFGDIDNDGYLDIYLTTGRPDFAALMPNVMLRNTGANKFEDVTVATGLGHLQKGHGVAFADIDRDGDQDIYHQLGGFYPGDAFHNALFENRPSASIENEPPNRFLVLKLIGTTCNRQAIGARVRVVIETPNGLREIHRAAGFVSSFGGSPSRLEIGLSRATAIRKVEIVWPGTNDITVTTPSLDSCVTVTQGEK